MLPLRPSWAKILLKKSPAHCKAAMETPFKQSKAMELGSYVDWLVFGGPEPEASEAIKERADKIARPVLELVSGLKPWIGRKEIDWTDGDGVPCQIHPDLVFDDAKLGGYDLKTAADTSDAGITRAIELFGYDIQVAAYEEGVGGPFGLLFIETAPPYEMRMVELAPSQLVEGRRQWNEAKRIWKQCWETGKWPGRGNFVSTPSRYRAAKNITVDMEEEE